MNTLILASGVGCAVAFISSPAVKAETIYSNLGPKGQLYSYRNDAPEFGQDVRSLATAFRFPVKGSDYTVTTVRVPLQVSRELGKGHSFLFVLADDASGRPGASLFQQQITHAPPGGTCCRMERVNITKPIKLLKGHSYWVETLPSPNTPGSWALVVSHVTNVQSETTDGGQTWGAAFRYRAGALAVYGTPVN